MIRAVVDGKVVGLDVEIEVGEVPFDLWRLCLHCLIGRDAQGLIHLTPPRRERPAPGEDWHTRTTRERHFQQNRLTYYGHVLYLIRRDVIQPTTRTFRHFRVNKAKIIS